MHSRFAFVGNARINQIAQHTYIEGKIMKAHIWYGPSGQILAVGSIQDDVMLSPGSDAEGVEIIEVEVTEEQLQRLHETHKVNVNSQTLVPS
jgi:hypothetical protein